jgi:hypothetical protein
MLIKNNTKTPEICLAIIILLLYIHISVYNSQKSLKDYFVGTKFVKSNLDGRKYATVTSYDKMGGTPEEAAEVLADLNNFLLEFMSKMKNKYVTPFEDGTGKIPIDQHRYELTKKTLKRYNPDVLMENKSTGPEDTSYVIEKGTEVGFCLRELETGKDNIHHMNDLKFVALHELSHIANESFGHETLFWYIFKLFLQDATSFNLINIVNYKKEPIVYCGMKIDYSPYYDEELQMK